MIVLLSTVLLASLLGSLHCAGMCGAFVAMAAGPARSFPNHPSPGRPLRVLSVSNLASYNLGRLAIYCGLGAVSGSLGAALDMGGGWFGTQRIAAVVAGLAMIAFGVVMSLQTLGVHVPMPTVPRGLQRCTAQLHRAAAAWPPTARSASIGLLSGLLPCGWLYAFVLIAGGTSSPLFGMAVMAAFWLGTLPILVSVGAGLQVMLGVLNVRSRFIASLSFVVIGLLTAFSRLDSSAASLARSLRRPAGVEQSIQQAAIVQSTDMPCCRGEGK